MFFLHVYLKGDAQGEVRFYDEGADNDKRIGKSTVRAESKKKREKEGILEKGAERTRYSKESLRNGTVIGGGGGVKTDISRRKETTKSLREKRRKSIPKMCIRLGRSSTRKMQEKLGKGKHRCGLWLSKQLVSARRGLSRFGKASSFKKEMAIFI